MSISKIISTAILIFIVQWSPSQESTADLGVAGVGLVVSDIDISQNFYKNIIGMEEVGGWTTDSIFSREAGFSNNRPFQVKVFKMQDRPEASEVKLVHFKDTGERPRQTGIDTYPGMNYLTLQFNSLKEVSRRLKEAKVPIVGWVKRENFQVLIVRDPDGIFVELVSPPD